MTVWTLPGYTHSRELVRDVSGQLVLAQHDQTGEPVAIRYLPRPQGGPGSRARAAAAQLAGLDDPHIAVPRDVVESDRGIALIRDLVDGVALRALLVEEGAVGPEAALALLADVLRGLAAAHGRGVSHGDCRPGTVLVTRHGRGVLLDAGVASPDLRELMAAGTPFYLAPEQWGGADPGPQPDIYAATATFFECVAGAPPYFGTAPALLRARHETAPLPVDALPEPLRAIAGRGLAKRPQDRPATAEQFLAEVELAAVRGFGEQWESRGRAELHRLATGPQPPFPLDAATASDTGPAPAAAPRASRPGRLGPTGAVAAVAAAFAVGLVAVLPSDTPADGRGSSSAYDRVAPSPADTALAPSRSAPRPRIAVPGAAPLASRAAAPTATSPDDAAAPTAAALDAGPTAGPRETAGEPPTARAAPAAAPARVTGLSIDSFSKRTSGTRLVVHVDTSGPGPVQLFLGYGSGRRGDADSTSTQVTRRELSGHTSYAVVDERGFGEECLDYWSVMAYTDPAGSGTHDFADFTGAPCGPTG